MRKTLGCETRPLRAALLRGLLPLILFRDRTNSHTSFSIMHFFCLRYCGFSH
ncbi:Uncharacterized protein APZ42_024434 [Daphnia magna]|uniref:Uncharacterized protein n=1 Tax=Daphnia magna TaxID=35525 RepID=A0A164U1M3_9CRUS|nr:Uncharacterized protein APZ42_024434 [Daphnia magna]